MSIWHFKKFSDLKLKNSSTCIVQLFDLVWYKKCLFDIWYQTSNMKGTESFSSGTGVNLKFHRVWYLSFFTCTKSLLLDSVVHKGSNHHRKTCKTNRMSKAPRETKHSKEKSTFRESSWWNFFLLNVCFIDQWWFYSRAGKTKIVKKCLKILNKEVFFTKT